MELEQRVAELERRLTALERQDPGSAAAELAALDEAGTTGQIYHHLRQLTGAGWLHAAGRGRYEIPPVRVVPLLVVLTAARP
ncbi:hypothetical protein OG402_17600 [Streptomyces anulatus]|nr:hypothetical protein [Streptomyces anulatus]MCX4508639.1 hypothetical protein [Streptomyces anulatus]MCX4519410.1 hypothetical protein [Streptomyces anulatus]MCX4602291.1 hypothetical protein [Streptomyces anulatus]